MATLKDLSEQMNILRSQLDKIMRLSGYEDYQDLSGLSDYEQIRTADERQIAEEYRSILYKLDEVYRDLNYLNLSICEVGTLHLNPQGRYETESGYYYTSGSGIEFLRQDEVYDYEKQEYVLADIWTCSRVESENGQYYIVYHKNLSMDGLKVRIRK